MKTSSCLVLQVALVAGGALMLVGCGSTHSSTQSNAGNASMAATQPDNSGAMQSGYQDGNRNIGNGAYGEPPP